MASTLREQHNVKYKRPFDLAILIIAHIVFAPIWILLWTLIPVLVWAGDRGPIFFRQTRAGRFGKHFTILKFRTMVQNSENVGPSWTTDRDHRITGVGKFLRRTAMDELPSIISIWKGDMSFVGPRALDVNEERLLEEEIPDFACRLNVLPGLTGLAQIKDKFDVATVKLEYDLEYIHRMNIWLDLWIMIVSVINTITAKWDQRAGKKK